MSGTRSRTGILVGLAAAVGACGATAMMAAVPAPTARADDFTDIVNGVEAIEGYGQTAFTAADTDFAGGEVAAGLQYFFDGANDASAGVPDFVSTGTLEALAGDPITAASLFDFNVLTPPADLADALTGVQDDFITAQGYFSDAASALTSGDLVDAAFYSEFGSLFSFDLPAQELLVGAVEALGL